jgi:starch synthase/alpha-amylase
MDAAADRGNGFLFEVFDGEGLFWAVKEAMQFYKLPADVRDAQIRRVMTHAQDTFTHARTAQEYIHLYEKMLHRPLITPYA